MILCERKRGMEKKLEKEKEMDKKKREGQVMGWWMKYLLQVDVKCMC